MSVTIDKNTGFPVHPPKITLYWYVVLGYYGDGRVRIEASSREELDALYEKGHARKEYGWIYEGGTCEGYDRQAMAEYQEAFWRIWSHSCIMPPPEDLKLLSWAKKLPPERYAEIDPDVAFSDMARRRLRRIRVDLRNELRWNSSP